MIENQSLYTAFEKHILSLRSPKPLEVLGALYPNYSTETIEELIESGDPEGIYRLTVTAESLMDGIGPQSFDTHPYQQLSMQLLCELLDVTDKLYQGVLNPTIDTKSAHWWIQTNSWKEKTADPILQAVNLNHVQLHTIVGKLEQHYIQCGVSERKARQVALRYPANIALTLSSHEISPEAARFINNED